MSDAGSAPAFSVLLSSPAPELNLESGNGGETCRRNGPAGIDPGGLPFFRADSLSGSSPRLAEEQDWCQVCSHLLRDKAPLEPSHDNPDLSAAQIQNFLARTAYNA